MNICRQRTRLAEALLAVPSRTDRYFDDHPGRRWLWLAIAFAAGASSCTVRPKILLPPECNEGLSWHASI